MDRKTSKIAVTLCFLVLTVGGGALIGYLTAPGPWFEGLAKPPFNPPAWLFAPVWTVLYVLIGIAGARSFLRSPSGPAMQAWWVQLLLNFAWSPVFFSLQSIGVAFAIILALLAAIIAYIQVARRDDGTAALLFVPYLAWVCFATVLNGAILWLN